MNLAVCLLWCGSLPLWIDDRPGQEEAKPPVPVRAAAKLGSLADDGAQTLNLTLEIAEGWHIYAHKPGIAGMVGTTIAVAADPQPASVEIDYPPGVEVRDDALQETYRKYTGKTQVRIRIRRMLVQGKPDDGPLHLSIRYQACNETTCQPPKTLKLKVEAK